MTSKKTNKPSPEVRERAVRIADSEMKPATDSDVMSAIPM